MINNLSIALFEPRIPQNTGNIARTCAAFHLPLILIEPLGFSLEDKYLKRAGLDYWPLVNVSTQPNFDSFLKSLSPRQRLIGASSYGGKKLTEMRFNHGDVILFGREDKGITQQVRSSCNEIISIQMPAKDPSLKGGGVRSLNLSVACSIVAYHAGCSLNLW